MGWTTTESSKRRSRPIGIVATMVVGALLVPAVASRALGSPPATVETREPALEVDLDLRPLSSAHGRIVDDLGRDVILRGANLNSLGQYWQGVPTLPANLPVGSGDWDSMAAHGFSVVRLIVSWSRLEPTRGVIDNAYLDLVDRHVRDAAARGIYTVIDMHQDAFTDSVHTLDPASCPPGTSPAKGWDGAPAWATLTDGLSTCLTGSDRNSSPAVTRAWNNFYDDVDGIRTEFASAWSAVARRFAGRPEVAGYDLINEPEVSEPSATLTPKYEALLRDVVTAIRGAEVGTFDHIVFVEPGVPAGNPSFGLVIPDPAEVGVGTTNVVSAPHNYAESIISGITIEQMSAVMISIGTRYGLPTWIGEYGFWDLSATTLERVRRYAADEDRHMIGGAWWQWRQSCGDPHSVQWRDGTVAAPTDAQIHLNILDCPGNDRPRANEAFLDVLGRGYPRAVPGILTNLVSDPSSGDLVVEATAAPGDVGRTLVVWTPTADEPAHRVLIEGLTDLRQQRVAGGRILTAVVPEVGAYSLRVGIDPDEPATTTTSATTTTASTTIATTATTTPTTNTPTTSTTAGSGPSTTSTTAVSSDSTQPPAAGPPPATGPVALSRRPTYVG